MTDQDLDSVDERLAQTFDRIAALRERLKNWDPDAELPPEPTPEPEPDPEPENIALFGSVAPPEDREPLAASAVAVDDAGTDDHPAMRSAESVDRPEPDLSAPVDAHELVDDAGPIEADVESSTPSPEEAEPAEPVTPLEPDAALERDQAASRRTQALRDLEELDARVAAGAIDPDDAQQLRQGYLADAEKAHEDLAELESAGRRSFLRPRVLAGAVLLFGGIAAAVFAVTQLVGDRDPGTPTTGDIVSEAGPTVDFNRMSTEEMEAALLETQDATEMRLALARRYVQAAEFQKALPHYLQVLQQDVDNVEAHAYLGWIEYLSGAPAEGAKQVEKAVAIDADDPLALAMLAVIRLEGLGDARGAIEVLDRMATNPHLPDDLRQSVADMRARAEAAS